MRARSCFLTQPLARFSPVSDPPASKPDDSKSDPTDSTRKSSHLDLCISADVGFRRTTLFEQVTLVHCPLPELALSEVDISTRLAGQKLRTPIVIASMTGGNERAKNINRLLGEAAEAGGYAIGLGSQRSMIKTGKLDKDIGKSFSLRDVAPTVPIFANLGVVQVTQCSSDLIEEMVQFVGASALCVHMNPAQEMIQPEGDRDFRGCLEAVGRLARELSVPVIAKETGCGISRHVAEQLAQVGVRHVDVSGAGGTSWVGVETKRASGSQAQSGELYWNWGIPTAASVLQVQSGKFDSVIATGGMSNGLEVAKAIALGAHGAGMARPILQALDRAGVQGAVQALQQVEHDLRIALLLTGSPNLAALRKAARVIGPELEAWNRA